jgi:hypothetical protein
MISQSAIITNNSEAPAMARKFIEKTGYQVRRAEEDRQGRDARKLERLTRRRPKSRRQAPAVDPWKGAQ